MNMDHVIRTMLDIAKEVRRITFREAADTAGANLPDNELGEYMRGRLDARDAI